MLGAIGIVASLASVLACYFAWRALDGGKVDASQAEFRRTRDGIVEHFGELCRVAAELHMAARPALRRIGSSTLLVEEWMVADDGLVPVSDLRVVWDPAEAPHFPALVQRCARIMPLKTRWRRYPSYSAALGDLARPRLYENRESFRLVDARWHGPQPTLTVGRARYFDVIDQNESLAQELEAAIGRQMEQLPAWRLLPIRMLLRQDPLSLRRRPVVPSIVTLTLRRAPDGTASYFLLYRDAAKVATGGGIYGAIPGGMFQPASVSPLGYKRDMNVWHNIMREYNEEMLGAAEATGSGGAEVDYTQHPYNRFNQALSDGGLRVWVFGMGLEPLNLCPCVLTAAVFEASVFDRLFRKIVDENEEGKLVSGPRSGGIAGLPFDEADVHALIADGRVAPSAAALLHLALEHRDQLLADPPTSAAVRGRRSAPR